MANFGRNMKVTARKEVRDKLHALMTEGLGCQSKPATEQMQLYLLEDGFNIGIYYTEASDALADEEGLKAPWLEFLVDDVDGSVDRLIKLGARRIDYVDKSHVYLHAPGGLVFRLAAGK